MISGVFIIRNGTKLGYPYIESLRSLLPLCDEVVCGIGGSDDDTRERIASLNEPKIRIVDTVWDMANRSGGTVLSRETNRVLKECRGEWVVYLQADEVFSDKDYTHIRTAIERANNDQSIDGLYFKYLHFYGSYFTIQTGRNWYRQEVRIIRNHRGIVSHGDAQGFRKDGAKIIAAPSDARVFHYGWARPPEMMREKIKSFHRFWHDDDWIEKNCADKKASEFFGDLGNVTSYDGDHPAVMKGRITRDGVNFIRECRAAYLRSRGVKRLLKDMVRLLPFCGHRNFKKI